MAFAAFLFWALGALLLAAAAATVTVPHPVHAALCLILSFFTAAMLWMLLEAEFLSILLVLVYIGAVLLLFLFVVMMLGRRAARRPPARFRLAALAVGGVMAAELAAVLATPAGGLSAPAAAPGGAGNTAALGAVLYTEHALAFEAAAVVLLIAIVGAVALTLRRPANARRQRPGAQMRARGRERVRLVDGRSGPPC